VRLAVLLVRLVLGLVSLSVWAAWGLYLQPYTQSVCLETCPTGFTAQDKSCLKTADSRCSFSLQTWGQEITALSFTALRGSDKTAQRDPQPSFGRGYYFDGDSELTLFTSKDQHLEVVENYSKLLSLSLDIIVS
jgi:hypothetical protein